MRYAADQVSSAPAIVVVQGNLRGQRGPWREIVMNLESQGYFAFPSPICSGDGSRASTGSR